MEVISATSGLRQAMTAARATGRNVGFVPTMGALHAGHISLVEACKSAGNFVVVSIYVNPAQFGPNEDYASYPRTMEADLAACRKAGVDAVFSPDDEEMYPPGDQTRVQPGPLAAALCGPFRPGHFEGVCTVVAKLLGIVRPDLLYLGQKDAQQALVLSQMVRDLCMGVEVVVCPTVREPDGLAMSSRNARLSADERTKSLCLYRTLCLARDRLLGGERSCGRIIAAMRALIAEHAEIKVDYLSIVDGQTLETVAGPQGRLLVAGAIRVGATRLIDNLFVDVPAPR